MLAKKTSKNRLTLPKAVVSRFQGVDYFEVSTDGATILLRPFISDRSEAARHKLEALGVTEQDVSDAVKWARDNP